MARTQDRVARHGWEWIAGRCRWCVLASCLVICGSVSTTTNAGDGGAPSGPSSLDETRVALSKWIETQQIISKERKEWQQGKEILLGRIELVEKEIASIESQIKVSEAVVAEARKKRDESQKENDLLKAVGAQLSESIAGMEAEVRQLFKQLPDPLQKKDVLQALFNRISNDPTKARVSIAERYQNVLGILSAVNKANNELTVTVEVRAVAGGKSAEVRVLYLGLAEAYYLSATGDAGIGHPTQEGWKWEPANSIAGDVLQALEIIQGKQTAAFVPLPVKIR